MINCKYTKEIFGDNVINTSIFQEIYDEFDGFKLDIKYIVYSRSNSVVLRLSDMTTDNRIMKLFLGSDTFLGTINIDFSIPCNQNIESVESYKENSDTKYRFIEMVEFCLSRLNNHKIYRISDSTSLMVYSYIKDIPINTNISVDNIKDIGQSVDLISMPRILTSI